MRCTVMLLLPQESHCVFEILAHKRGNCNATSRCMPNNRHSSTPRQPKTKRRDKRPWLDIQETFTFKLKISLRTAAEMGDLTRVGKASHWSRSSANDVSKRFTSMSGIQMCGAISTAGQVMKQ